MLQSTPYQQIQALSITCCEKQPSTELCPGGAPRVSRSQDPAASLPVTARMCWAAPGQWVMVRIRGSGPSKVKLGSQERQGSGYTVRFRQQPLDVSKIKLQHLYPSCYLSDTPQGTQGGDYHKKVGVVVLFGRGRRLCLG